jgi:integrase
MGNVVTRSFVDITRKQGLKDVTVHTLRHTFISHCLMHGLSPWEVGKWVGHSSVYITELYGHLSPDRREIDRLKF